MGECYEQFKEREHARMKNDATCTMTPPFDRFRPTATNPTTMSEPSTTTLTTRASPMLNGLTVLRAILHHNLILFAK